MAQYEGPVQNRGQAKPSDMRRSSATGDFAARPASNRSRQHGTLFSLPVTGEAAQPAAPNTTREAHLRRSIPAPPQVRALPSVGQSAAPLVHARPTRHEFQYYPPSAASQLARQQLTEPHIPSGSSRNRQDLPVPRPVSTPSALFQPVPTPHTIAFQGSMHHHRAHGPGYSPASGIIGIEAQTSSRDSMQHDRNVPAMPHPGASGAGYGHGSYKSQPQAVRSSGDVVYASGYHPQPSFSARPHLQPPAVVHPAARNAGYSHSGYAVVPQMHPHDPRGYGAGARPGFAAPAMNVWPAAAYTAAPAPSIIPPYGTAHQWHPGTASYVQHGGAPAGYDQPNQAYAGRPHDSRYMDSDHHHHHHQPVGSRSGQIGGDDSMVHHKSSRRGAKPSHIERQRSARSAGKHHQSARRPQGGGNGSGWPPGATTGAPRTYAAAMDSLSDRSSAGMSVHPDQADSATHHPRPHPRPHALMGLVGDQSTASSKLLQPGPVSSTSSAFLKHIYRLAWNYANTSTSARLQGQRPEDPVLIASAVRGVSSLIPLNNGTEAAADILTDPLAVRWLRERLQMEPPTEGGLTTVTAVLEAMKAAASPSPAHPASPADEPRPPRASRGAVRALSAWRLRLGERLLEFVLACQAAGHVACGTGVDTLLERCTRALSGLLDGRVVASAMHEDGTRLVQAALTLADRGARGGASLCRGIAEEMNHAVAEMAVHRHANYALQAVVPLCAAAQRAPMIHWIQADLIEASCSEYGCRLVQRILEHCGANEVSSLRLELASSASILLESRWGRFVVQLLVAQCRQALTVQSHRNGSTGSTPQSAASSMTASASQRTVTGQSTVPSEASTPRTSILPAVSAPTSAPAPGAHKRVSVTSIINASRLPTALEAEAERKEEAAAGGSAGADADDSHLTLSSAFAEQCLVKVAGAICPALPDLCQRRFGSEVVEHLLGCESVAVVDRMAATLTMLAPALSCAPVGNFVIQKFLSVATGAAQRGVVAILQENAMVIGASAYGRHVLDKLHSVMATTSAVHNSKRVEQEHLSRMGIRAGSFTLPANVFGPAADAAAPRVDTHNAHETHYDDGEDGCHDTEAARRAISLATGSAPTTSGVLSDESDDDALTRLRQLRKQSKSLDSAAESRSQMLAHRVRSVSDDTSLMVRQQSHIDVRLQQQHGSEQQSRSVAGPGSDRLPRARDAPVEAPTNQANDRSWGDNTSTLAGAGLAVVAEASSASTSPTQRSQYLSEKSQSRSVVSEILWRSRTSLLHSGADSVPSAATAHGALGTRHAGQPESKSVSADTAAAVAVAAEGPGVREGPPKSYQSDSSVASRINSTRTAQIASHHGQSTTRQHHRDPHRSLQASGRARGTSGSRSPVTAELTGSLPIIDSPGRRSSPEQQGAASTASATASASGSASRHAESGGRRRLHRAGPAASIPASSASASPSQSWYSRNSATRVARRVAEASALEGMPSLQHAGGQYSTSGSHGSRVGQSSNSAAGSHHSSVVFVSPSQAGPGGSPVTAEVQLQPSPIHMRDGAAAGFSEEQSTTSGLQQSTICKQHAAGETTSRARGPGRMAAASSIHGRDDDDELVPQPRAQRM